MAIRLSMWTTICNWAWVAWRWIRRAGKTIHIAFGLVAGSIAGFQQYAERFGKPASMTILLALLACGFFLAAFAVSREEVADKRRRATNGELADCLTLLDKRRVQLWRGRSRWRNAAISNREERSVDDLIELVRLAVEKNLGRATAASFMASHNHQMPGKFARTKQDLPWAAACDRLKHRAWNLDDILRGLSTEARP